LIEDNVKMNESGVGVMDLDLEGEDGDDQGGVREAAVDRGRGVHRKDVSVSGTPEVKATTSAGAEAVMDAPAKFKANVRDVKSISSIPAIR
jgi:hypothetical protein